MPLSATDLKDLLAFGREQGGAEFKSAGSRTADPTLRAKVVRGILAMANRRDGGTVVVGVREDANGLALDSLNAQQAASWKHDDLADTVAEYADPRVVFDSYTVDVDGVTVVVISVNEFADVPVVCKRTFQDGTKLILRDGAVYVRSNRKPESREVANYDEMRELLDIATDKGVRRFVARATEAGLVIGSGTTTKAAADAYKTERGDL
jgi:predicted HTH transcriptional regulator